MWKDLGRLYITFFKIGAFMFGGGYSMLPLLTKELVERRGWESEDTLLDYFAVAQCTPGIIAINTATFVGHKRRGWLGAAVAVLGVLTAPVALILLIAMLMRGVWAHPLVVRAFHGIRVAVAALIVSAVARMIKKGVKNGFGVALCAAAFLVVGIFGQSPVWVVLAAAAAGLLYGRLRKV